MKVVPALQRHMRTARNPDAWALGTLAKDGTFTIRRIVWGRLLARSEKRAGETIARAYIEVWI